MEKYFKSLEKRLEELQKNSVNAYIARLKQSGIIMDSNDVKQIMHHSMEDLEEILKVLSKLPFMNQEIKTVLKITNISIVRQLKEYIDKGYILPEFACDTHRLWNQNSNSLEELSIQFKTFQFFGLNPQIFSMVF